MQLPNRKAPPPFALSVFSNNVRKKVSKGNYEMVRYNLLRFATQITHHERRKVKQIAHIGHQQWKENKKGTEQLLPLYLKKHPAEQQRINTL